MTRARAVAVALGVTLLAAGTVLTVPAAWQVLVVDPAAGTAQEQAADRLLGDWPAPSPVPPVGGPDGRRAAARIPVAAEPPEVAADVAVITVPRFGGTWRRIVRQGVDPVRVLNSFDAGVGHYPGTAMPGGVGNFAIAGHDTGWGDAFRRLKRLRLGDRIEVRTAAGTYVYVFRNFESVTPDTGDVLAAVPRRPGIEPRDRLITLTTCDPPYDAQDRLIAYGVLDGFRPAAAPGHGRDGGRRSGR